MPNLAKIAKMLGLGSEEEAATAIDEATRKTGSISKISKILGIPEDDARELVALKIKGDDAGFAAKTRAMNLTEAMRGANLI